MAFIGVPFFGCVTLHQNFSLMFWNEMFQQKFHFHYHWFDWRFNLSIISIVAIIQTINKSGVEELWINIIIVYSIWNLKHQFSLQLMAVNDRWLDEMFPFVDMFNVHCSCSNNGCIMKSKHQSLNRSEGYSMNI